MVRTIGLIIAIYKSSVTQAPVQLPLAKGDVFNTKAGLVFQIPKSIEKKRSVENFTTQQISLGCG